MRFCFIDYRPTNSNINRDMTGNFGSDMNPSSFVTSLLGSLKRNSLKIPISAYSQAAGLLIENNDEYEIVEDFPNSEFDIFIFMTSIVNLGDDKNYLRKLKNTYPESKVGVVGALNKASPNFYDGLIDFNIMSELDSAILSYINGKWNFEGIYNEPNIIDIDIFPLPNWDKFPINSYRYKPGLPKQNFLTIQSSRGCSFNCDYCSYMVVQGGRTRNRSLDLIKLEIEELINKYGVKSILFRDILFGHPKTRFYEIVEVLSEFKNSIEWGCETRIELLNDDLIKRSIDAGMKLVNIGIESPNIEILSKNGKKTVNHSETERRIKIMNESGLKVQAFYMLGLIGENRSTIIETIKYAKKLNTFAAQFCLPTPYPGTKFAEDNKELKFSNDIETYDAYTPQLKVEGMTQNDLRDMHSFAYRSYYLNLQWFRKNLLNAFKGLIL